MSLNISMSNSYCLDKNLENKLIKAFEYLCSKEKILNSSINFRILNDIEMTELNKKFRKKNKSTNVLSFTNEDISKSLTGNLGDIAVSYEFLEEESKQLNKNFDDHIIHLSLIHI